MNKITRKEFLKGAGYSVSALALSAITPDAFAEESTTTQSIDDIIAEMNAWYKEQGKSFVLESISSDLSDCTATEVAQEIEMLKSIQTEVVSRNAILTQQESSSDVVTRAAMPVPFNYETLHRLNVSLHLEIVGYIDIKFCITGTVDRQYNNIWNSSGIAYEHRAQCLDELYTGAVTTLDNSPSTGYVSYSCPCSARFVWQSSQSGVTYSGTDRQTFTGTFAP